MLLYQIQILAKYLGTGGDTSPWMYKVFVMHIWDLWMWLPVGQARAIMLQFLIIQNSDVREKAIHTSNILLFKAVCAFSAQCENGLFGNRWLIGYSAYPCTNYLLTLLSNVCFKEWAKLQLCLYTNSKSYSKLPTFLLLTKKVIIKFFIYFLDVLVYGKDASLWCLWK